MIPASLYRPLYAHSMLLLVLGCALVYWYTRNNYRNFSLSNHLLLLLIGVAVVLFLGFRPVSGIYFVDMGYYANGYVSAQLGNVPNYPDPLFNALMRLCAPILPTPGFFFVCMLIYVVPLAIAPWRVHGAWAFPVFLAFISAFSFWGYGVNGIRNGLATSVLILAFAFHDKPVVMLPLMAVAWGFHASILLPAVAFVIVRYVRRTELWLIFWLLCAVTSLLAGNVAQMLVSRFHLFGGDNRLEGYILGSEGSGFRADFLIYSISPLIVALVLAAPSPGRKARFTALGREKRRVLKGVWLTFGAPLSTLYLWKTCKPAWQTFAGSACVYAWPSRHQKRPAFEVPFSNLSSQHPTLNCSRTHVAAKKACWSSLPWVRLLRFDPFYARLVNTYLMTNAFWILLIHAEFSNRFAYLSWFMMPWVLLYPFVPGRTIEHPRTKLIAATLCAHYLFTYIMVVVVYPLRGIRIF